jgi:hypothetical protein
MHIVVDTLCLSSTLSLLAKFSHGQAKEIHYFQRAKGLGRFYLLLLHKLLGCKATPIVFSMGDETTSTGELLKHQIEAAVMASTEGVRRSILMKLKLFDKQPYAAYPKIWLSRCLEHRFIPFAYQIMTCLLVAKNRFGTGDVEEKPYCLVTYTPLSKPLLQHCPGSMIPCSCHGGWLLPVRLAGNLLANMLTIITMAVLAAFASNGTSSSHKTNPGRVGVQYCWGHDTSKRSDLYWLAKSGVPPERVLFYFDRPDYPLTPEISADLQRMRIPFLRRLSIKAGLMPAAFTWFLGSKKRDHQTVGPQWCSTREFGIDLLIHYLKSWGAFLRDACSGNTWMTLFLLNDMQVVFIFVLYWKNFYDDNNIVININHSGDTSDAHAIQSLAIQKSGGINIRSNYSFLSIKSIKYSREFHVYFPWGPMAKCCMDTEKFFSQHVMSAGYPFDNIFDNKKISLKHLKFTEKHRTIVVFDEAYGGSSIFSQKCVKDFYTIMSRLALRHNDVGLLLKPKSLGRDDIAMMSPECCEALNTGKAYLLEGESPYKACVGAELAVCVGINSAGIEAALFGLPVLFLAVDAVPCPLLEQEDAPRWVYHDSASFLSAIECLLAGEAGPERFRFDASVLDAIDPYRDGRAGERIGFFIHEFLKTHDKEGDAGKALEAAVTDFSRKWEAVDLPTAFWV